MNTVIRYLAALACIACAVYGTFWLKHESAATLFVIAGIFIDPADFRDALGKVTGK